MAWVKRSGLGDYITDDGGMVDYVRDDAVMSKTISAELTWCHRGSLAPALSGRVSRIHNTTYIFESQFLTTILIIAINALTSTGKEQSHTSLNHNFWLVSTSSSSLGWAPRKQFCHMSTLLALQGGSYPGFFSSKHSIIIINKVLHYLCGQWWIIYLSNVGDRERIKDTQSIIHSYCTSPLRSCSPFGAIEWR